MQVPAAEAFCAADDFGFLLANSFVNEFHPLFGQPFIHHLNDFIDSLSISDSIFILPVYSAGEKDIKKIDSLIFSKLLSKKFKNKFISLVKNEIIFFKSLKKIISPGDNIIFLGAGKSAAVAERFCKYTGLDQ